jgi:hypothetical protein
MRNIVANVTVMAEWVNATAIRSNIALSMSRCRAKSRVPRLLDHPLSRMMTVIGRTMQRPEWGLEPIPVTLSQSSIDGSVGHAERRQRSSRPALFRAAPSFRKAARAAPGQIESSWPALRRLTAVFFAAGEPRGCHRALPDLRTKTKLTSQFHSLKLLQLIVIEY